MSRLAAFVRRLLTSPAIVGLAALVWLVLRTGRKPSRLTYPCQRAALGSTTLILGLPIAHVVLGLARRLPVRRRYAIAAGILISVLITGLVLDPGETPSQAGMSLLEDPSVYPMAPRARVTSELYLVENAGAPLPDRHPGVDAMVACMADGGLHLYRSTSGAPGTDPEGIVGADDVVLIKVNGQWSQRGGTNTDVLRGILRRIVEHPDGFTGEVVVVENTQGAGTLDWPESNAEDHSQSVVDVVNDFILEGWPVSTYLWDTIRTRSVGEYADGDLADGYVVNPIIDPESQMRVSYPKFRTAGGSYVSLARGVWDETSGTYDDANLTFINVPILKCHSIYAVTAAIKHHVGTMTTSLSTSTHAAVGRGGCGSFLAEVRMPDLNILDCIYILARPGSGPACSYAQATFTDKLVAGVDPIALDIWAVTNILVPAIIANGYTSYPAQDPENASGTFRVYLDRSMNEMLLAGLEVTNDLTQIATHTCEGVGVEPIPAGSPPAIVSRVAPNPLRASATIHVTWPDATSLPDAGTLTVDVFDPTGRWIRTLAPGATSATGATFEWDARDASDRPVAAGVYLYRARSAGRSDLLTGGKLTVRTD